MSPARQQIVANPGEEFPISIKFYNQGEYAVAGFVKVSDFIVEDDKGTPIIVENATQASPKYSASTWFTLPFDRMGIGANSNTVVRATLKIPSDARPGGRYAAIYFEPLFGAAPGGQAGASITPRIASLLYIRVSGPITERALITNMFARTFNEYGPIDVSAKIINKGDYHIRPKGTFTLTDSFGTKMGSSKLHEVNIFPEAERTFGTTIGQKWMMGRYKISLNAQYGSGEQFVNQSISVWVFPWRVATIVLLSIIIVFALLRYYYRNFIKEETSLKSELNKEKEEIERLKKQIKNN